EAFIQMIPLNFYAMAEMILVFIVANFKLDIGTMRTHEKRAIETGELLNTKNKKVPGDFSNTFNPHEEGKVYHLLAPICVLIITTVTSMVITGDRKSTRLNSSHVSISYAVFCLKKKINVKDVNNHHRQ